MIPQAYITEWRKNAPWPESSQIEQDLVLSKALVQIYTDPLLKDAFAFRGGTALQKLFFDSPTRYSEDIDLVQVRKEPIGEAIDSLRKLLDPWLGIPKRERKTDRVRLTYKYQSEIEPVTTMRLKIEINNGEHLTVMPLKREAFQVQSTWFSGTAEILTYEIEELLGTKLRALFQRKKGRDLYDMSMAFHHFKKLDTEKMIECFQKYMAHEKKNVSRAQYEANLVEKLDDIAFTDDIVPILAPGAPKFDARKEGESLKVKVISLLPGEPWKGKTENKTRKRRMR